MKTINSYYTDKKDLENFIKVHNIKDADNALLQIFTGICDENFINNLVKEIKEFLPNINIIGSTTDGEIKDKEVTKNSTVLSFSVFEKTRIEICTVTEEKSSFQTGKSLIAKIPNIDSAKLAIVFADGLNTNGEIFLKAFNKFASHITVAGGLSGDNAAFTKTYLFTQDGFSGDGAVCAILYNPDLIINTTLSFGWKAIGKEFTVTRAVENRVYSIDNQTPLQIYKKYLGDDIGNQLPATGIEFPLIIKRDDREIARAIVAKEDDGSLIFAGNIKTGDKTWLGYGNIENILRNTKNLYEDIINNPVESIFIYSCMARKRLLGDEILNEILPLTKIAPTSGFFTYGEFFHNSNKQEYGNQLLNQTMTVLTLSENSSKIVSKNDITFLVNTNSIQTIEALSHLISQTTRELQELNQDLENKVKCEVEKNRLKDQHMVQQSRLAQMGEMIGNIAHQWRQPLNALNVNIENLEFDYEDGVIDKEFLDKFINKQTKILHFMSNTIDDFRNFFRVDKEKISFSIKKAIQDNVNIQISELNKYGIAINIQGEDFIIDGFQNEFLQVIMNLISNAKDAIVETKQKDGQIDISLMENKVTVTDNGGGIPSDIIERIFEPYYTTKEQGKGTGMGLYMSKMIIEDNMGGKIGVSNVDGGASFTIKL